MNKLTIAFDVDGTLIRNDTEEIIMNERIVVLLQVLSSFKNVKIIVWSWRWEDWARYVVSKLWLEDEVDWYASKNHKWKDKDWKHIFEPDIKPDIAIDDIQACNLWVINLICKEK